VGGEAGADFFQRRGRDRFGEDFADVGGDV